ncbi:CDC27 family protein [Sulfuricurvum sp.]|uniref:CDC27 family protein n=1 Tax=Sulfuricurvum sp. TaxID=2025608 RepID=UPI0019B695CB|nr:CDC27 family protein [Sulfuricurvum sp.]MBD3798582.1 CDC27 family protein [Campylobacterota bacterium]MBD3806854.1 CDC27 family protein [Sulfuricurvum sp.]
MLDVQKLERRWLKYKLKKTAPYILTFFAIAIMIITTLLWFNSQSPNNQPTAVHKEIKNPISQPKPKALLQPQENTTVLEPSMGFIQDFEPYSLSETTPKHAAEPVQKQQVRPTIPASKPLQMPEYSPTIKAPPPIAPKTSPSEHTLSINHNESKLDIEELKLRFKETSNVNLGLFIARYYYDHGEYNEAYNYALKTNTINSQVDESWIIFSKSLVKLGKTDQAKKTLQLYISHSNSESARSLLDLIESGSFK